MKIDTELSPASNDDQSIEGINGNLLLFRSALGGILMGLANLLPGISGGTMLLVAGIYPNFIQAVSDLTRLRFSGRSLTTLMIIALMAGLSILMLAGLLKDLVLENRWIMYSLFIGLTLGGLPLVIGMARPLNFTAWFAALVSLSGLVGLAVLQAYGIGGGESTGFGWLMVAGVLGASAMILPGLSGAYLLMLLGQYVPILSAIETLKTALKERDWAGVVEALSVMVPVGIGVLIGIIAVSNLIRWLLTRYEKGTLGALIGLLLGSIIGLYPFQVGVPPQIGDLIKGQPVTAANIESIKIKDWPTEYFFPSWGQAAGAVGLIVIGFLLTAALARIGRPTHSLPSSN